MVSLFLKSWQQQEKRNSSNPKDVFQESRSQGFLGSSCLAFPQCPRLPSLTFNPRSGQCGTEKGTRGLQSGGIPSAPSLASSSHPHVKTAGLQQHQCLQFRYRPGGGAVLGKPGLLGSEAGEGLSCKAGQLRVETSISVQRWAAGPVQRIHSIKN